MGLFKHYVAFPRVVGRKCDGPILVVIQMVYSVTQGGESKIGEFHVTSRLNEFKQDSQFADISDQV